MCREVYEKSSVRPLKILCWNRFYFFLYRKRKRSVIDANETTWRERLTCFIDNGKLTDIKERYLTCKLFIEESPDPYFFFNKIFG